MAGGRGKKPKRDERPRVKPERKTPRALSDAPPTNRSQDEIEMRIAVQAWGRLRWPGCRVVHELVTEDRRIDMAFVTPTRLIGVEIKSNRDTLDRLWDQLGAFQRYIPEVWVAYAPRWAHQLGDLPAQVGRIMSDGRHLTTAVPPIGPTVPSRAPARALDPRYDPLWLLWREELAAVADRLLPSVVPRASRRLLVSLIRDGVDPNLILPQVCRELRARDAFWRADPPIVFGSALPDGLRPPDVPFWSPAARQSLF